MAKLFCESFDKYGATADLTAGKWNTATGGSFVTAANTAFSVGQGYHLVGITINANFETGTNETTIYFSIRYKLNQTTGVSTNHMQFQFRDGTNVQCTIDFARDLAIRVYSGTSAGTLLATATSAFAPTTWDSYQGKIVINNTTGSVEIRKNGSSTPITGLNLTNVNTRAGSTNNYVNNFLLVNDAGNIAEVDDIWLNSDNGTAPTTWPGDVRLLCSATAGNTSTQFSPIPTTVTTSQNPAGATAQSKAANTIFTTRLFTPTATGLVNTATLSLNAGFTGNIRMALYAADGVTAFAGAPGTVMATSNQITNPGAGVNTFTFPSPPTVVNGVAIYLAWLTDATFVTNCASGSNVFYSFARTYGSGFVNDPNWTSTGGVLFNVNASIIITPFNWFLVSDALEDQDATYLFDSTVGHKDIMTIAGLGALNPASIIGVDTYVCWKKSDSGARGGTIGMDANGSGDTALTGLTNITPSLTYVYKFGWRELDPTGAAWTTANVNGIKLSASVAS